MQKKKAKYLIVDATPFIQNALLHDVGENIYTISEVVEEIRNKRQLRHLASLTYDLQIKNVFPENVLFVNEFSKKTGDYASLSRTDIKLIALAYQLELEHVGGNHLRKSPVMKRFDVNAPRKSKPIDSQDNGLRLPVKVADPKEDKRTISSNSESLSEKVSSLSISHDSGSSCDEDETNDIVKNHDVDEAIEEDDSEEPYNEEDDSEEQCNEEDDSFDEDSEDETGWVTPGNINQLKQNVQGGHSEVKEIVVGCMSTDFAVQNVLMQMGLNVVALDGRVITELRSYVLRCYACFKITTNMKKVFCPTCGLKTLKRVSVYLDKDGKKCININFKKPISTKGKRFSLPMPQTGKHAVNPRLVEDAKRPHQKPSRLAKMKTDALEPDYIAGISPFATRDIYSKSAQLGFNKGKPVFKYWMRRNPNEARRNPKK